jgi:hypothetical protein
MKNTGDSGIVCFTILVLPVLLDEEYWLKYLNKNERCKHKENKTGG